MKETANGSHHSHLRGENYHSDHGIVLGWPCSWRDIKIQAQTKWSRRGSATYNIAPFPPRTLKEKPHGILVCAKHPTKIASSQKPAKGVCEKLPIKTKMAPVEICFFAFLSGQNYRVKKSSRSKTHFAHSILPMKVIINLDLWQMNDDTWGCLQDT